MLVVYSIMHTSSQAHLADLLQRRSIELELELEEVDIEGQIIVGVDLHAQVAVVADHNPAPVTTAARRQLLH